LGRALFFSRGPTRKKKKKTRWTREGGPQARCGQTKEDWTNLLPNVANSAPKNSVKQRQDRKMGRWGKRKNVGVPQERGGGGKHWSSGKAKNKDLVLTKFGKKGKGKKRRREG